MRSTQGTRFARLNLRSNLLTMRKRPMTETLVNFDEPISDGRGARYSAQAMGRQRDDGLWEGWLEFLPLAGNSERVNSGRETTQPNRNAVEYWAQGLTRVYLAGALERAKSSTAEIEREREAFDS
jgi:hypothetical protein